MREMVGRVGFEPTTNGLKGRCSTTELPTRTKKFCNTVGFEPTTNPNAFGVRNVRERPRHSQADLPPSLPEIFLASAFAQS